MNAKTVKGILYGIAVAIAFSATAATVYNYFPPPGMTYSPTTGFVVGSATGGAQGAGTVNAQGVFVNGAAVVTGAGLPVGANPTGTVGLTAVNGSATTFLRSDGAPPLSQSIAPTWTGVHTFANAVQTVFNNASAALNAKNSIVRMNSSGQFVIQSATDAAPTTPVTNAFEADRTGSAWSALSFGNATDNPTYSFLGSGTFNVAGGVTIGSPTGGSQGAGTINMQGCFVNGVACSTGGAAGANPTATIGLTAVNGSAGTFLRSDGAPALSQAIAPTWTGTHGFNGTYVTSSATSLTSPGQNGITFVNSSSGANAKIWDILQSTANHLTFRAVNDAFASAGNWLDVVRSGLAISSLTFGNSTDQPTYQFNAVPTFTVNGTTNSWSYGGSTAGAAFPVLARYNAGSGGTDTIFYHSRGATIGTNTILQSGDEVGSISFDGSDGTATPVRAARIIGFVDGTPSAGTSYPGRLEFYTVPSGSTSIVQRMILDNNGSLTINAPTTTSKAALTVNGLANSYAAQIQGSATSGQSLGERIYAGTTSADVALAVANAAQSTNYFIVWGDGGIQVGNAPTGGDPGPGIVNASSDLRVNNVSACLSNGANCGPAGRVTLAWSGTCSGTGCITGIAKNSSGVTRNSAGNYTVGESTSIGSSSVCTATTFGSVNSGLFMHISSVTSTTVNVLSVNSSGTQTDVLGFSIICMS